MSYIKLLERILNNNCNLASISFTIKDLNDDIYNFILLILQKNKNCCINLYINESNNFKNFVYTKNIFVKLHHLQFIGNIHIYTTLTSNHFICINDILFINLDENLNRLSTGTSSNYISCFTFSISDFSKKYLDYVLNKENLFDNDMNEFYLSTSININSKTIPQFSSFENACFNVIKYVIASENNNIDFITLGHYLYRDSKNDIARKKYGENHSKFSQLIDLCYITRNKTCTIHPTKLGELSLYLSSENLTKLITFQLYKLDIIQLLFLNKCNKNFSLIDELNNILKPSTANRRLSNINKIYSFLTNKKNLN